MKTMTIFLIFSILFGVLFSVSSSALIELSAWRIVSNWLTYNGNVRIDGNLTIEGDLVNISVVDYNISNDLDVGGTVTASYFEGDGSLLTNINLIGNETDRLDYLLTVNINKTNTSWIQDNQLLNTSQDIWDVIDNTTFLQLVDLSTLIDNTTIIRNYDKLGNTTEEIIASVNGLINSTSWNRSGTDVFLANTDDNVGIGTIIPLHTLDIVGDILLTHTAIGTDEHGLEIVVDAAGFGDVKGIDINYVTGGISLGEDEEVILMNIDESLATGGDVIGVEILATEGLATIYGLEAGVGVSPIVQLSGTFENMDSANNSGTSALSNFTSQDVDSLIFTNDNDFIILGNSVKFEEIEFLLNTSASINIKPTFEFSTGVNTWTMFTPADGTDGLERNGVIAWFDDDIPTWAVGTGNEYLIRITRTKNNVVTTPIEDKVQISSATKYMWDKNAHITVFAVNATNFYQNGNTVLDTTSKVGNTTSEIQAQFTGSNNISIVSGVISFNATCIDITGSADLCDGGDATGAGGGDAILNGTYAWFSELNVTGTLNVTGDAYFLSNIYQNFNLVIDAISLDNSTIIRNYDKIGNTTQEIWGVVDNETWVRIDQLGNYANMTDLIGNETPRMDNLLAVNINLTNTSWIQTNQLLNTTQDIWNVVDNSTFAKKVADDNLNMTTYNISVGNSVIWNNGSCMIINGTSSSLAIC